MCNNWGEPISLIKAPPPVGGCFVRPPFYENPRSVNKNVFGDGQRKESAETNLEIQSETDPSHLTSRWAG